MSNNLAIWSALYTSDPAHVTKITGKSYQGDSPKPQWVIKRLTEQFGPVGKGFGWIVVHSVYLDSIPHQDGVEKRHECRIRFWWRDGDGVHEVESAGGTRALFKARNGAWMDDEDAEKKSITDAVVKAASWLGVAGDVFMGQWNDSAYQAELRNEHGAAQRAESGSDQGAELALPQPAPLSTECDLISRWLAAAPTLQSLKKRWTTTRRDRPAIASLKQVRSAYRKRWDELKRQRPDDRASAA